MSAMPEGSETLGFSRSSAVTPLPERAEAMHRETPSTEDSGAGLVLTMAWAPPGRTFSLQPPEMMVGARVVPWNMGTLQGIREWRITKVEFFKKDNCPGQFTYGRPFRRY